MTQLQQIVQWMMEQGYLVQIKGKYRVTAKFNKEMTGKETGLVMIGTKPLVMENSPPVLIPEQINWPDYYLQFIKDAEVPARSEGRDGSYDVNKYSEEGMKAFRKAIEKEKVNYQLLVNVTRLYYKSHRQFAVKIGNYMAGGNWRTDYQAALEAHKNGQLTEHIQQELDNDREYTTVRAASIDLGDGDPGFGTQPALGQ